MKMYMQILRNSLLAAFIIMSSSSVARADDFIDTSIKLIITNIAQINLLSRNCEPETSLSLRRRAFETVSRVPGINVTDILVLLIQEEAQEQRLLGSICYENSIELLRLLERTLERTVNDLQKKISE